MSDRNEEEETENNGKLVRDKRMCSDKNKLNNSRCTGDPAERKTGGHEGEITTRKTAGRRR